MKRAARSSLVFLVVASSLALVPGIAQAVPFTGSSGDIDMPIPDGPTGAPIESTINIVGAGAIVDVNVAVRISHTYDSDLDITLISPTGTTRDLSSDNGTSGDNYGSGNTDCTGTFTVFDDAAATTITTGTPPFAGSFRPEQALSALNGTDGAGNWKLRIDDQFNQDLGVLHCWELRVDYGNGTSLSFPSNSASVSESVGTTPISVHRSGETSGVSTVDFATTSGGTAIPGVDYESTSGTLTFPAGDTGFQSFPVSILDDSAANGPVTVELTLSSPTGGFVGVGSMVLTIAEDEAGIRFAQPSYSGREDTGIVILTVQRAYVGPPELSATWTAVSGSATSGSDFPIQTGTVTIPSGQPSATIPISITDDDVSEPAENFSVELSDPSGGALALPSTASVSIDGSDLVEEFHEKPDLRLIPTPGTIDSVLTVESDGTIEDLDVSVRINHSFASDLDIFLISPTGTMRELSTDNGASGDHYGTGSDCSATTRFDDDAGPSIVSGTAPFTGRFKPEETLSVFNGQPAAGEWTLRITDDTLADQGTLVCWGLHVGTVNGPTVAFEDSSHEVEEGAGEATVTVVRPDVPEGALTVDYLTESGSADEGSDFTSTSGTLIFAEGETTKDITVPLTDDTDAEDTESFTVRLQNPTGGVILNPVQATVSIAPSDIAVFFESATADVSEDGGDVELWVRRSAILGPQVTVYYATSGDTATSGSDFTGASGTLTFEPGEELKKITVAVLEDSLAESDETFDVHLSAPDGGAVLGTPASSSVTIASNDSVFSFQTASATVSEGTPEATLTVARTFGLGSPAAVHYETMEIGTADDADFTSVSGELVFGAGEDTKLLNIPIANDATPEKAETIEIRLMDASPGASVGSTWHATVTINESDTSYRPDGMIRLSTQGTYVGNNVYNSTGAGQTKAVKTKRGTTKTFFVDIQNDGNIRDAFTVMAPGSGSGFTVSYFLEEENVTAPVVAGTLTLDEIAKRARWTMRIVVKVSKSARAGAVKGLTLRTTSVSDPTKVDVVKGSVKATV
jgi:subtilisin-like proprotein convertase family protein